MWLCSGELANRDASVVCTNKYTKTPMLLLLAHLGVELTQMSAREPAGAHGGVVLSVDELAGSCGTLEGFKFGIVDLQAGRRDIFFEMLDFGRPGNGQHYRGALKQPRQCDL